MVRANHIELLVEEASAEAFFQTLLPRLLPQGRTFAVHASQGKADLLKNLTQRLAAYAHWLPDDWRLFVVVDRDSDDCLDLKRRLEAIARQAGLMTRSRAGENRWQLANRIVVEELEAWYFGDWDAVRAEYPRAAVNLSQRRGLRDPDAITGGTWETFEREMQRHGYFKAGLTKIDAARRIASRMAPERNRSASFQAFHAALMEALA